MGWCFLDKVMPFEGRKLVHNYLTGDREAGRVLYDALVISYFENPSKLCGVVNIPSSYKMH